MESAKGNERRVEVDLGKCFIVLQKITIIYHKLCILWSRHDVVEIAGKMEDMQDLQQRPKAVVGRLRSSCWRLAIGLLIKMAIKWWSLKQDLKNVVVGLRKGEWMGQRSLTEELKMHYIEVYGVLLSSVCSRRKGLAGLFDVLNEWDGY